jgi:hypothetical protein
VLQKAELSGDADSENNHGGSSRSYVFHEIICIPSDWIFTRRRSMPIGRNGGIGKLRLRRGMATRGARPAWRQARLTSSCLLAVV